MRRVIEKGGGGDDPPNHQLPSYIAAALLSQAIAVDLAAETSQGDELVGIPVPLFFEIMRVGLMYESDDVWSSIDRVVRIWRTFGDEITTFPLRATPTDLLLEATGLELEELLGLGFALYSHATQWSPGDPPFVFPKSRFWNVVRKAGELC